MSTTRKVVIKKLAEIAEQDPDQRMERQEMWEIMDAQHTHTTDKELKKFMSRSAYDKWTKDSPADQQTAQTAKTLVISVTSKDNDTISGQF